MTPQGLSLSLVPKPVLNVLRTLQSRGFRAVIVGGAVRDLVLGRPTADWDVASSASTDTFQELFPRCHPTGLKHGTVTVVEDELPIEVTTFRGDGAYTDGRRPDEVRFGVTLEEDLSRRDFTINAMAWDPLQTILHDPFGGEEDLRRHRVRAVGEALTRFMEDGLRPMRAIRISSVLGFEIEPNTLRAIPQTLQVFRKIALERIRDELVKTLTAARPSPGLRLLRSTGLLAEFLPELGALSEEAFLQAVRAVDATLGSPIWRLAALLRGAILCKEGATHSPAAEEVGRRLRLSVDEISVLSSLVALRLPLYDPASSDAHLRRLLKSLGGSLSGVVSLQRGELLAAPGGASGLSLLTAFEARTERLLREGAVLSIKELAVNGEDLMTAGVPKGPKIGALQRYFLERVLDEPSLNQKNVLLSLLPEALSAL